MRKFILSVFAILLAVSVASAQCSSGSCGSGRGARMMPSMMSMPTIAQAGWGSAEPTIASNAHREIVEYVNAERVRVGLLPVKVDPKLCDDCWSAVSPLATGESKAMKLPALEKRGITHAVAEGHDSPMVAVQAWMRDPAIRKAILSESYTTCGFKSVQGSNGHVWRVLAMGGNRTIVNLSGSD